MSLGAYMGIVLLFEILAVVFTRFDAATGLFSLDGAAVGVVISIAGLRLGLLDAGGWDWFSSRRKERERSAAAPADLLRHMQAKAGRCRKCGRVRPPKAKKCVYCGAV